VSATTDRPLRRRDRRRLDPRTARQWVRAIGKRAGLGAGGGRTSTATRPTSSSPSWPAVELGTDVERHLADDPSICVCAHVHHPVRVMSGGAADAMLGASGGGTSARSRHKDKGFVRCLVVTLSSERCCRSRIGLTSAS
jgi:hypothetical protein